MDKDKVMNIVNTTVPILVSLGAINWGLIGFFDYNIIDKFLSGNAERIVYALIGLAAVYNLGLIPKILKKKD